MPVVSQTLVNRLLGDLSCNDCERMLSRGEQVSLTAGDFLGEPNLPIRCVYFPNTSIPRLADHPS
jgi:hypothetical protein